MSSRDRPTAVFPKFIRKDGVTSLAEMEEQVYLLHQKEGRHFTLCYWPEPDASLHRYGVSSNEVSPIFKEIDSMVERLSKKLSDTIIVISADHGLVDVEEILYIDDYPEMLECLAYPLSLDDRSVSVFLKQGKKEAFLKAFQQHFQKDFLLLSRNEVFKTALFGHADFNKTAKDFIGDYLIVSVSGKSLHQRLPNGEKPVEFKGSHAGLMSDEVKVPLIIA
jgi:predicted AlkP superfamily pyrophosphatase or phosphodiesterase